MQREQLLSMAPTAQVRELATELLRDGKVHSRREIVESVKEQGRRFGFPAFREGHLAGGVREAVTNMNCTRIGRGMFQAPPSAAGSSRENDGGDTEGAGPVSLRQRSIDVCGKAASDLADIAREINYATAGEEELRLLGRLREYVARLRDFENY